MQTQQQHQRPSYGRGTPKQYNLPKIGGVTAAHDNIEDVPEGLPVAASTGHLSKAQTLTPQTVPLVDLNRAPAGQARSENRLTLKTKAEAVGKPDRKEFGLRVDSHVTRGKTLHLQVEAEARESHVKLKPKPKETRLTQAQHSHRFLTLSRESAHRQKDETRSTARSTKEQLRSLQFEMAASNPMHSVINSVVAILEEQAFNVPILTKFSALLISIWKTSDWVGVCAAMTQFLLSLVGSDTTSLFYIFCLRMIRDLGHSAVDLASGTYLGAYRASQIALHAAGSPTFEAGMDPEGFISSMWNVFNDPAFEASELYQSVWGVLSTFTIAIPLVTFGIFPSLEAVESVIKRFGPALNVPHFVFVEKLFHLGKVSANMIFNLIKTRDPQVLLGGANHVTWLNWCTRLIEDTSLVTYDKKAPPVILPHERVDFLERALDAGGQLLLRQRKWKSPPQAMASVEIMMSNLRRKIAEEKSFVANNHSRVTPFFMMLLGASRIGKTEMCREIHAALMLSVQMPHTPDTIYNHKAMKFWDGFTSMHTSVMFDDPDKCPAPPTMENQGHVKLVNEVVNGAPLIANMASVESKGRIYVRPLTVFYATNLENAGVKGKSLDISHFWGRVSYRIKVTLKDRHMYGRDDQRLDPSTMRVGTDAWIFEVQKYKRMNDHEMEQAHMETFWTTDSKVALVSFLRHKFLQH